MKKTCAKAIAFDKKLLRKILIMSKLCLLLLTCSVLTLHAGITYSQQVKINLEMKNATLNDVINEIKKQTEFEFAYDASLESLKLNNISLNVKNENIDRVLASVFQGTLVNYKVIDKIVLLSRETVKLTSGIESSNKWQQKKVTGKVIDATTNDPIPGVNITVEGTTIGTVTDIDGKYSLDVPSENVVIIFSFVGYNRETVALGAKNKIDISLVPDIKSLEEVVVIGYGTRAKRDVTTAISTVTSDKITKVVPSSPELLMQGQMSGVQILGNQGNPNARPTVRIRGTNTFGVADPLYVIDGIPIKEWGAGIEGSSDQYTRGAINVMAMIDPNDIESISVLKDASSAAIYGVRAANGVVLITTKKGKKERATVNYSQRYGFQNLNKKIDLLNTQEYANFNNAMYASDPASEGSRSPLNDVFRPTHPSYLGNSPTYDWQDAVKNHNALTQDYSVNVSGGNEKADYYVSFGYSDQDGVFIDNNTKRYNGSLKLNVNINKYLRVGINYRLGSSTSRDLSGYVGSLLKTAMTPVWQPIYDPEGINGFAPVVNGYDENQVWKSNVLYGSLTRYNMPGLFSLANGNNTSLRNMGNAYVEIEPLTGLKLKGTINIDNFDNTIQGGSQYISSYFKYDGGDPKSRAGEGSVGDYGVRSTENFNMISELTANYIKSFGKHNIDLLFNAMSQKFLVKYMDVGTDYVTSTNPDLINLGGENKYTRTGGFKQPGALEGFLFRTGYNYANKYYIDATIRRDGSARFAPSNRWGTFPALSVAWRISEENFLTNLPWMNDLKLRGGWGQLGNQEVQDLAYLSTINGAPTYAWGNNPTPRTDNPNTIGLGYTSSAAAVYGMANRNLQWEKTSTLNIGFDAVVLDNLNFSFEYYNKLTDGILQQVTLPPSTGVISMPQGNVAQVRNSGIEMNLNYNHSFGDLNISFGGNFTTVKNKVEKLYGGIPMWNIEEGQSLFYIRGYKLDGIFQSDEEAQKWLEEHEDVLYQTAKVRGGDFYFKDLRGAPKSEDIANDINKYYSPGSDSIVDNYDQVYIGKTIPGFYYGFNVNVEYKGLDFSAQFTGVGDVQKVNNVKSNFSMPYGEAMNHTKDVLNAWTPENKNASVPRMIWQDPASNGRFSDYFVENAGYLRLANIQLGYTFPKSVYNWTNSILQNARIYVGCSNPLTFTKFGGLDPEDEYNPAPLIVYTGLNIKF